MWHAVALFLRLTFPPADWALSPDDVSWVGGAPVFERFNPLQPDVPIGAIPSGILMPEFWTRSL